MRKAFTSPDRQLGINAARVPAEHPTYTGGPLPLDTADVSAPVPPDATGSLETTRVSITRASWQTANAPAAAPPSEPEAGQLIGTPGRGVNGLTPYAVAGGNSYQAGGTGRSRTAPMPKRRK